MEGPPKAVSPKRRKDMNNCQTDGRGVVDKGVWLT